MAIMGGKVRADEEKIANPGESYKTGALFFVYASWKTYGEGCGLMNKFSI